MNFLEDLEKRCREHGEKECLFDGVNSLSYADLWKISGQVYAYLKTRGVGKEQTVMISMDRNVYALTCIIGILRSGAAFVVMGQDYPEERKAYIKKDSECVLEITEALFKEILLTAGADGFEARDLHDLAYLVHTSGTTGNPKCVMHEFGNIDSCRVMGRTPGENIFSATDRMGITAPINFVACLYQFFYALSCGACFALIPKQVINNLKAFRQFMEDHDITDIFMTPSLLKMVGKLPPNVKRAFIYGEVAKEIYDKDVTIYNVYAQSETGHYFAFFKIDRPYESTPIGLPAYDVPYLILDKEGQPVADGQEGELCTKLPYFRGYKNLPEQNAKALSGGVYHTGDVAQLNEDGELVLKHRMDTMVKINGNRVELTEIENRMREIIGGAWAAVNICENGKNTELCAYYVDELPLSVEELKKQMAQTLAIYMLPSFYMKLDKIPLNANGKFSRRLLPAPDFATRRKEYKAPVSAMQQKVVSAFEKVLKIEEIGIDEDFFELGGDSLGAIHVITELDLAGLLTTDIFNLRNAEALAEKCEELAVSSAAEEIEKVQPLIGTQNFMEIYHEKLSESTAYNLSSFYRLKKGIDLNRLQAAIVMVMNCHQAFRTTIRKTEAGAELVMGETIREPEIIATTEAKMQALMDRLVKPYELYENLLYKCKIFRTEKNAYLFFEMHHILTDGTSLQIILKEIEDGYNGIAIKEDEYFRLIQDRVKERESARYVADRSYYVKKMPGNGRFFIPPFDFMQEGSVPGIAHLEVAISEQDLLTVKERFGLAPTDFFIMCYLIALSRMTGSDKVGTAFTVSGRDSAMAQNAVGLLLRSYYVNLDLEKEDTAQSLALRMRRELAEIQQHRSFDVASFMTETNAEETACSNILYQDQLRDTTENIKNLIEEAIELPDHYYKASYYWEFEIINHRDSMEIVLYYNASRYSGESARRMLEMYREVCTQWIGGTYESRQA